MNWNRVLNDAGKYLGALAFATFLFHFLAGAYDQVCGVANKTEQYDCTAYNIIKFTCIGFLGFVNDYHDALIALGTLIVAAFTGTLWRATTAIKRGADDQLIHMRASSERQLRAYIYMSEVKIHPIIKDRPVKADITIKNFGKTPGYQVKSTLAIQLLDNVATPPQIQAVSHDATSSVAVFPPGFDYKSVALGKDAVMPYNIDNMVAKKQAAFIFGRIDYIDAFGNECFTEFRVKRVHSDDEPIGAYGSPTVCENGNRTEYDEKRAKS